MTNKELAEKFAKGSTSGKSNNMFIEADTIYSYGKHYPIAEKLPSGDYWVNPKKCSKTTTKHMSLVIYAIQQNKTKQNK